MSAQPKAFDDGAVSSRPAAPRFVSASCPVARFHPPRAPKPRPSIAVAAPPAFDLPKCDKGPREAAGVNLSRSLTNNALEGWLSSSAPSDVGQFLAKIPLATLQENSSTVFSMLKSFSLPASGEAGALLNARAARVDSQKKTAAENNTGIAGLDFNLNLDPGKAAKGEVVADAFQLEGVEEGGFALGGDEEGYVEEEGYEEGEEGEEGAYDEAEEGYEEEKEDDLSNLY